MSAILRRRLSRVAPPQSSFCRCPAWCRTAALDDWPQWRGPKRDGVSAETGLLKDWPAGGPPAGVEGGRRRRGLLVVCDAERPALHARRPRRHRVRDGVRRRDRQEALGDRRTAGDSATIAATVRGRRRRSTATRLYAFGASGDLSVMDAATGKVYWTVNVLKQFGGSNITWGLSESPLVLSDRILVNAWRPRRIDRRAEEDRRIADLEEPERRSRVFVGGAARGRRRARSDLSSPASARSASTSTTGKLLWSYDTGRQQHRQHRDADRARQPRVLVVRLRHRRRAARADARRRRHHRARRSTSRARCATITPARCSSATTCTGSPTRSSRRCSSIPARSRGGTAASARARSCSPTTGCICTARTAWSGWPKRNPDGYREHGRFELQHRQPADVEPSGRVGREAVHQGPGHDLRVRRAGEIGSRART